MKVLQVTRETYVEKRYGLGKAVLQLNAGLARAGVDSDYFCAGDLGDAALAVARLRARRWAEAHGAGLLPIFEIISRAWETGIQAADKVRSEGHTHVHCHDSVVAHGYMHARRDLSQPIGTTQHGFDGIATALNSHVMQIPPAVAEMIVKLESAVLSRSDWSVFLTRSGASKVTSDLGLATWPALAHVIPHAKPDWAALNRREARDMLGWRDPGKVLLAVGQIIPLKRFEWIVRAIQFVDPEWRLVILGEGDASAIMRLADQIGIARPLITSTDEARVFFAAADAYTSASSTESFGMAHLEALTMNLPVACTAVGGVPEVTGDAALLLDDDEQIYSDGLCRFLQTPALRDVLADRAKAHVRHWPDLAAIGQQHVRMYLGARNAPGCRGPVDDPFNP